MSAVFSGAAQGAQTGAMFGPWGAAIGAGIGAIGGALGSRSARRAAEAQRRAREQQAGVYRQVGEDVYGAYGQYGRGLEDLAGTVDERFAFTPVAARSGFGTASYGPDGFTASLST